LRGKRELAIYLDSSAIVKRYIEEPGSNVVRELYLKAYPGKSSYHSAYGMLGVRSV